MGLAHAFGSEPPHVQPTAQERSTVEFHTHGFSHSPLRVGWMQLLKVGYFSGIHRLVAVLQSLIAQTSYSRIGLALVRRKASA